jgi:hypothetical protein
VTRPFRFSVQQESFDDAAQVRAAARQIEALGYDEMFSYDHVGEVDPFVPLMVAAEATTNLRVGPLVLNNEFHHPALLARTAATVDRLTGGRLVLGMGTGYMQSEHDAIGLLLRGPGDRVSRFEESIVALRALLDHGSAALDGAYHHLAVDSLGVRPVQPRVPLLIGGHGKPTSSSSPDSRTAKEASPRRAVSTSTSSGNGCDGSSKQPATASTTSSGQRWCRWFVSVTTSPRPPARQLSSSAPPTNSSSRPRSC